jgi:hypothetical protein
MVAPTGAPPTEPLTDSDMMAKIRSFLAHTAANAGDIAPDPVSKFGAGIAESAAKALPGSNADALRAAANVGANMIGPEASMGMQAAKALIPVGASVAGEMMSGKGVMAGVGKGIVDSVVNMGLGGLFGKAANGKTWLTESKKNMIANRLPPVVGQTITDTIPMLERSSADAKALGLGGLPMDTTKALKDLPETLPKYMGKAFDKVESQASDALTQAGKPVLIPTKLLNSLGLDKVKGVGKDVMVNKAIPAGSPPQPASLALKDMVTYKPIAPDQAVQIVKDIGQRAWKLRRTESLLPDGTPVMQAANDAKDALMKAVGTVDPELASRYNNVKQAWQRTTELMDYMEPNRNKFFPDLRNKPGQPSQPGVNIPAMNEALTAPGSSMDRENWATLRHLFEGNTSARGEQVRAGSRGALGFLADTVKLPETLSATEQMRKALGLTNLNHPVLRALQNAVPAGAGMAVTNTGFGQ